MDSTVNQKLKQALPITPNKRAAVLSAYVDCNRILKSPGVKKFHDSFEESVEKMAIRNIQDVITSVKHKRNGEAKAALNTSSVSGENISDRKRATKSLANILGITVQEGSSEVKLYESLSELVDDTLCTRSANTHQHKISCLDRLCSECGVCKFSMLPGELDESDVQISWERYEYKNVKVKGDKMIRKLVLVRKSSSPAEMFQYLEKLLETFPAHQFRAYWQSKQMKSLVENLPIGHCVTVHDFSENYKCTEQNEIQSSYFQKLEVSLHVTILHRHSVLEYDGKDSTAEEPNIVTEQFFVISPDQKHDHHYTHCVQNLVSEYLKSINCEISVMHEFTDGCSSQYKSRHCKAEVLRLQNVGDNKFKMKRNQIKKPFYDMKVTFSRLDEITSKTRARANRVNMLEEARLHTMQKIIEKEERFKSNILDRMLTRSDRSHKRLKNRGYKRPWVQSPKAARHFAQEIRIYHGGYDRRNFEKEIERKIRQVDPTRVQKILRKVLTEQSQTKSNFIADRNLETTEFYEAFKQKMNPKIRVDRHGKHITVDMRESSLQSRHSRHTTE
ncbi:unnamed protein product [Mytilus edulis]|uniref:Uncharacterized protein n=1 Tax=Mytilus edulis TaxID=6550 RepID=A0A8S3T8M3_MYTED|nr:unnamed protein product [Mytilus edulis]